MWSGSASLCGGVPCPTTDWVYWMMPDRPDGYALFEAAANGFGGPGAVYDRDNDGDTQIDPDPASGGDCGTQGVYAAYCYRNDVLIDDSSFYGAGSFPGSTFVYPIGRLVLADLAGDGTTPPPGTVIRLYTEVPLTPVIPDPPDDPDDPDPDPVLPDAFALSDAYPNPSRGDAVFYYAVPAPSRVRLSVYDVLGRLVAEPLDGEVEPGVHAAVVDGARLASGSYVVVFEGPGVRFTRRLTHVR
jgi:hypothetical protein